MEKEAPSLIILISVMCFIAAIGTFVSGFFGLAILASALEKTFRGIDVESILINFYLGFMFLLLITSFLQAFIGWKLKQSKNWARMLVILEVLIGLFVSAIELSMGKFLAIIPATISISILAYLTINNEVKEFFAKTEDNSNSLLNETIALKK